MLIELGITVRNEFNLSRHVKLTVGLLTVVLLETSKVALGARHVSENIEGDHVPVGDTSLYPVDAPCDRVLSGPGGLNNGLHVAGSNLELSVRSNCEALLDGPL